jgi:hypothetical protein
MQDKYSFQKEVNIMPAKLAMKNNFDGYELLCTIYQYPVTTIKIYDKSYHKFGDMT